jgi:hypothetical protein
MANALIDGSCFGARRNHLQILRTINRSFCITALNYLSSQAKMRRNPAQTAQNPFANPAYMQPADATYLKHPHPKRKSSGCAFAHSNRRNASRPSTALIGDIAVWRTANGIDSQDRRPTGVTQPETLPDLWKQHLDRDVAHAVEPHNSNLDQRQAPRKALRHGSDHLQRPYRTPRPNAPSSPDASHGNHQGHTSLGRPLVWSEWAADSRVWLY